MTDTPAAPTTPELNEALWEIFDECRPLEREDITRLVELAEARSTAPLDVERLSDFFHEEYWLDSPHRDRGAAEGSDCEVCWRSVDRLITLLARLSTTDEGAGE